MDDSKEEYYVLGSGTWRDLLPTIPRPVFAFGRNQLYRVMVHGSGFSLPVGTDSTARGFYTARFVAASNADDAGRLAMRRVQNDWVSRGHEHSGGHVTLQVEKIELLAEYFRLRSGMGFTFYSESDESDPAE